VKSVTLQVSEVGDCVTSMNSLDLSIDFQCRTRTTESFGNGGDDLGREKREMEIRGSERGVICRINGVINGKERG